MRPLTSFRRSTAALAALTAVLVGATGCGEDLSEQPLEGVVRDEPLEVGQIVLPDVTDGVPDGNTVRMKAKPGSLLVVYFGYTFCPDVCPTTLAALRRAYRSIGADAKRVETVMITVDPRRDTAEVLNTYLSAFFPDGYHAVRTTDQVELQAAEDAFLASSTVLYPAEGEPEVSHTGTTYVVDETGTVVVEWSFGLDAEAITQDLRKLLARTESA